jgi:antitoxin VapB
VSLNIKSEAVHALVREAAARTGMSQTSVVEEALRRYLEELDRPTRRLRFEELVADMQRRVREHGGLKMTPEDLYDPETGLPA